MLSKVQKRSKYKVRITQIDGTPPTAHTPGPNWLIFWQETPHVNSFRVTKEIFEAEIWAYLWAFEGAQNRAKIVDF